MSTRAAAEEALGSASVSSLVVKLPAAEGAMQRQEVTLESLTRSYRERLLLDGANSEEEPEDAAAVCRAKQPAGGKPGRGAHQRRSRQPRKPRQGKPLQPEAPSAAMASASWRQTQGMPLMATLFDPALGSSDHMSRPPGYFLVTPRLGERANLERRRWALRNTRRGQQLQVLGEPYWPAHPTVPSRPATARPIVSSKSFVINREQHQLQQQFQREQQQQQQQQRSVVSLASLIKRFPEDFVRLPTPDFRNSGLAGSQLVGRPPSASARMPAASPINCSEAAAASSKQCNNNQHQHWKQRQRPLTGRLTSRCHYGDAGFGTSATDFLDRPEEDAEDRLRVDGCPMPAAVQLRQHPARCRSALPKRDAPERYN
ncbi:hypothetical protein BOX15_Mlig023340g2 [Macrostomum lignano]|uniref:Uncharacterized protein n=2 Tax=Macrostomum lignano TaxID=282301 RepID=A0A267DWE5_9PLAT|nr:hypothetical protein BOX15_Mlig023340g2 [Macrostomum lignano]